MFSDQPLQHGLSLACELQSCFAFTLLTPKTGCHVVSDV